MGREGENMNASVWVEWEMMKNDLDRGQQIYSTKGQG